MAHAQASLKTVHGTIESSWNREGDTLTLDVTLPANTKGKVSIPVLGLENVQVTESGTQIWDGKKKYVGGAEGLSGGSRENEYITFDVASGSYKFKLAGRK